MSKGSNIVRDPNETEIDDNMLDDGWFLQLNWNLKCVSSGFWP